MQNKRKKFKSFNKKRIEIEFPEPIKKILDTIKEINKIQTRELISK